jgi:hypothetical protein
MAGAVHHGGRPLFMTHGLTSRQPGRWTCCPYRRTVLLRPALGDVTVVAGRENRFFAETRQGGPGLGSGPGGVANMKLLCLIRGP